MAAVLLELARDGRSVADLMDLGKRILGRRMVIQSESPNAISIDDCLNFDVVDDPILTKPNTLGSSDIVEILCPAVVARDECAVDLSLLKIAITRSCLPNKVFCFLKYFGIHLMRICGKTNLSCLEEWGLTSNSSNH